MEANITERAKELARRDYAVDIHYSGENYFAEFPELPGAMTWAPTLSELEAMIEDAKLAYIEDLLEDGEEVPEPREIKDYSGSIRLRIPKSVHRRLALEADKENVSLNTLMVSKLSGKH